MTKKTNCSRETLTVSSKHQHISRYFILALLVVFTFSNCKKEAIVNEGAITNSSNKNGSKTSAVPTRSEALLAMQVYNNQFYRNYGTYGTNSYKSYYWKDQNKTGRMDFWTQNEAIEMLIDAYYINPNADFKDKIRYLYHGIRDGYGTLWTNNIYNDDLIWGALMCVRAYNVHNDGGMLQVAKDNFNLAYDRGWDTALGGGLWWTTDKTSKNACVNAPAVICAMKLYAATGDVTYRNKAKLIMDWMVSKLYKTSGEVAGAMNASGNITEGPLSYTQGTFIGACNELRAHYPSVDYLGMANNVLTYTKNNMCNTSGGYLKDENGNADTQGMKSIFSRWACTFVKATGSAGTYGPWLDYNADRAWTIRNSNGLMWNKWGIRTSDTEILNAWQTSTGVSMVNNVYWYK